MGVVQKFGAGVDVSGILNARDRRDDRLRAGVDENSRGVDEEAFVARANRHRMRINERSLAVNHRHMGVIGQHMVVAIVQERHNRLFVCHGLVERLIVRCGTDQGFCGDAGDVNAGAAVHLGRAFNHCDPLSSIRERYRKRLSCLAETDNDGIVKICVHTTNIAVVEMSTVSRLLFVVVPKEQQPARTEKCDNQDRSKRH